MAGSHSWAQLGIVRNARGGNNPWIRHSTLVHCLATYCTAVVCCQWRVLLAITSSLRYIENMQFDSLLASRWDKHLIYTIPWLREWVSASVEWVILEDNLLVICGQSGKDVVGLFRLKDDSSVYSDLAGELWSERWQCLITEYSGEATVWVCLRGPTTPLLTMYTRHPALVLDARPQRSADAVHVAASLNTDEACVIVELTTPHSQLEVIKCTVSLLTPR